VLGERVGAGRGIGGGGRAQGGAGIHVHAEGAHPGGRWKDVGGVMSPRKARTWQPATRQTLEALALASPKHESQFNCKIYRFFKNVFIS
jgi:hypothetical protein